MFSVPSPLAAGASLVSGLSEVAGSSPEFHRAAFLDAIEAAKRRGQELAGS